MGRRNDGKSRQNPGVCLNDLARKTHGEALTVTMTPELERLLDEGLEDLARAKATDELRRK
jgi:hypothetical protein